MIGGIRPVFAATSSLGNITSAKASTSRRYSSILVTSTPVSKFSGLSELERGPWPEGEASRAILALIDAISVTVLM